MNQQAKVDHLGNAVSNSSEADSKQTGLLSKARNIVFKGLVVLFTLFLLAAFNLIFAFVVLMFLPESTLASLFGPGADLSQLNHRIHLFALSVFLWGMLIGTLVQLRLPENKIAPMLMALSVPIGLIIGEIAGGIYTFGGTAPVAIPLAIIALLHPEPRELLKVRRWSWMMVGLAILALGLWAPYAFRHLQLQRLAIDGDLHGQAGHWSYMVTFAFLISTWALIGSTNQKGWQIPAASASLASALIGMQSLLYPDYYSSLEGVMAIVMILWAILFLAAIVLRARTATKIDRG